MTHPDHLIFLHIPKTAGSTMQGIVTVNYPKKYQFETTRMWLNNPAFHELSQERKHSLRVLQGHMPFGLHNELGPGTAEYFTILREPVDRVISLYYHILRSTHHPFHKELVAKKWSYPELMRSGMWRAFDNCQVRMISGDLQLPYGEVREEHLQKAIDNLEKYFPLVGVQHHFDAFVLQLRDRYGWKFPYYRRHQVATNRVGKDTLTVAEIDSIREQNQLDEKLFRIYTERFEKNLAERGEEFSRRLARYRTTNRFIERLLHVFPVKKKH
jgi:hypothetical protein